MPHSIHLPSLRATTKKKAKLGTLRYSTTSHKNHKTHGTPIRSPEVTSCRVRTQRGTCVLPARTVCSSPGPSNVRAFVP